jgi:hypothetical protein
LGVNRGQKASFGVNYHKESKLTKTPIDDHAQKQSGIFGGNINEPAIESCNLRFFKNFSGNTKIYRIPNFLLKIAE